VFCRGDLDYRALWQSNDNGNLVAKMILACGERIYAAGTIRFASIRSKSVFVNAARQVNSELDGREIMDDLNLLDTMIAAKYIELQNLDKNAKDQEKTEYVLTADEVQAAEEYLRKPDLIEDIVASFGKLGIVGEEYNSIVVYLTYTSRLLDKPVHLIVKGESSSGKSFTTQTILKKLFPKEAYVTASAITPQALYYLDEDSLHHKILAVAELSGGQEADYALRTLQTEDELTKMVAYKDPETDTIKTRYTKIKGPFQLTLTTTQSALNQENETRHLVLSPDDSPAQTRRVTMQLSKLASGEFVPLSDEELVIYQNVQRVLKPYEVVIPYASLIEPHFSNGRLRVRRDITKFYSLIKTIAILHQGQREIANRDGREVLVASIDDYAIARFIASSILESTMNDVPPKSIQLLDYIRTHEYDANAAPPPSEDRGDLFNQGDDLDLGFSDSSEVIREKHKFTYQEISANLGWTINTVKKWMSKLVDYGCIEYTNETRGRHRAEFVYTGKLPERFILPESLGQKDDGTYEYTPSWKAPEKWVIQWTRPVRLEVEE
jgi:hypothetical protein